MVNYVKMKSIFYKSLLSIILLEIIFLSGGCGKEKNRALSLQFFDEVYVPVDPATFLLWDKVLEEKGIGNVTTSNTEIVYTYKNAAIDNTEAPFVIIYTDISFIPSETSFQPMRVHQCYEMVLKDVKSYGICVNPDVSGYTGYTMSKDEIISALPKIPKKEELPENIRIKV